MIKVEILKFGLDDRLSFKPRWTVNKISIPKETEIYLALQSTGTGSRARNRWAIQQAHTTKMAVRWLPNVEDFFAGVARLLETSENSLNSASYDHSEFLFRRLDAHERTLSTLLIRIEQSYYGIPEGQSVIRDLRALLNQTSNLRSHYERRFFLSMERESNEFPSTFSTLRNQGGPGRPRHQLYVVTGVCDPSAP